MRQYIAGIIFVLIVGAGMVRADEIVLENGNIFSGNVLALTEDTVSILVDGKSIIIERDDVHAVFLGEQTPFSSKGYPGLNAGKHDGEQQSRGTDQKIVEN
ncbi:MAG: hypothetical protein HUN04_17150 [Desulfobacter sp.]|nr:MAG: hypothetical protein HUN04_17150 [Desulfobacter sp.]